MYLVRVDDFPRPQGKMDIEKFKEFSSIMESYKIPYLLGVIPKMAQDDRRPESETRELTADELAVLKKLKYAKIAMHGVFHRTLRPKHFSEFIGMDRVQLEKKIKIGIDSFRKYKLKTDIIMPPFNTFDLSNLQIFRKYFWVVTGGPETAKIFGKLPIGNLDGMLYVPSYRPFYGQPNEIYNGVVKSAGNENDGIRCITLHWGWDIKNNFDYTRKIAELIKGKVLSWNAGNLEKYVKPVKIKKPPRILQPVRKKDDLFQYTANKFVLNWIRPGKFLDMACGNCQLMDYAKSLGCEATGTDIKPQRKDVIKHDLNKKLPFADRSFDIVSCIDSIEHVVNVSRVFTEANRVLKSRGIFIVTVPNTRWYKNHHHVSYFTYRYMLQLIKYSGFRIEEERHYVEIPKISRRFVFDLHPEVCFHLVFKLRKSL
jgi:SAM-dependent methyltransferase